MKASTIISMLASATFVSAGAVLAPRTSCSVDGGTGTCKSTSDGCSGGSFHAGTGPNWPCPGDDSIQCCIPSSSSSTGGSCSVDGGTGTCQSTSSGCSGGSFHAGTGPNWPCPGGNDIQCCIKGSSGGGSGGSGSGSISGLDSAQSSHAHDIMNEAKSEGVGRQGCLAAIATGLTEASLLVYANDAVPDSLNYPYDRIGSDHDSIGIFQQRASIYTDIAADMSPARSAGQFFSKMKDVSGWQTMNVGDLCQAVQVSAYPDRYNDNVPQAETICDAGGF